MPKKLPGFGLKKKLWIWADNLRQLPGDPRYIARGTAVGIFVSLTPTFPLHTVIAVPLAMLLRGSKRAAAISVWLSNPLTLPVCYIAAYKVGIVLLGSSPAFDGSDQDLTDMVQVGIDVTIRLIAGGLVLGVIGATAAYFLTKKLVSSRSFMKRFLRPPGNGCDSPATPAL